MEDTSRDGIVTPIQAALAPVSADVTALPEATVVVHDGPGMGDNWVEVWRWPDRPSLQEVRDEQ